MKSVISPWSIYDHLYQLSENNNKIIKKQPSPIYHPSLRKKKKINNEKQTYDLPIIVGKVTQPESIKEQYINIQKNNRSETHHQQKNNFISMQEVRHKAKKVDKQINSLVILQIIDQQLRINANQFNSISQKNANDQVQIKSFPKIKSKENLKISNKIRKMSLDRTPFDDDKMRSKVKRKSKLYIPNQILEFNSNNEY